jgi:hypothetical protein
MQQAATTRRFRAPQAIFWTALALRLAIIVIGHTYRIRPNDHHFDFGFEAGRIAASLVGGHGYGNPFNGPSGPTAWLPPLYPLLIAAAFKLFGVYTNASARALMALSSVFSAATGLLLYEIAARCFDAFGLGRRASRRAEPVALWAGWLWVVNPVDIQYPIHWIWEMSLTTLLFTWTIVLALRLRRVGEVPAAIADFDLLGRSAPSGRTILIRWAALGLLWGLIALLNPSLLLVFVAQLLWLLWPRAGERFIATQLGHAALCAVLSLAVLTPWIVRNERTLHAFIPTRDNLGVELWRSTEFYRGAFNWGTAMPLFSGDPEFRHYAAIGEVAYAREKMDIAKQRIAAHPHKFLTATLMRIQFFWCSEPHPFDRHPAQEYFRELGFSFLSVAGLLGLALALYRRVAAAWLFAAAIALVPIAYYAVTVQARFRHPLEPLLTLLAIYLFRCAETDRAFSWQRTSQPTQEPA